MNRLDWRAVVSLLLGASLFAQWSTLGAGLLLGGAAYLVLQAGYRPWRGGPFPSRRVKETCWRGRRIDVEPRTTGTWTLPVRPPLQTILCLALGTGLAVIAVSMLLAAPSGG
ncbi:MAG TPA: hypothetical protein VLA19_17720 [Herpetosiphonaceae bacterium]|nr:hypothetical protein [Herpetosiphonaceae bacterium]